MFKKVFALTSVCMLIFLSAAFLFINAWANSIAYDMTYSAYNQSFSAGLEEVNELLKSAADEMMSICIDEDVQAALRPDRTEEAAKRADDTLTAICRRSSVIDVNVFQMAEDGTAEMLCRETSVKYIPPDILAELSSPEYAGSFRWEVTDYTAYSIRAYKGIFDTQTHEDVLGVVVLEISLNKINSIFANICNTGARSVYLLDKDDRILFPLWEDRVLEAETPDAAENRPSIFHTQSNIFLIRNLNTTSWKMAMLTLGNPVEEKTSEISRNLLKIVLPLFVLMLGASLFIAHDTMTPFTRLAAQIRSMDPNAKKLEESARHPYKGEARLIFSNFNTIIQQRETLQKEIYDITLLKNEAELHTLQAQINPHFLYNTLDSISWMAMKYNATDIQQLVVAFSNMMRYALNNGEDEIPLRKELAQVEGYIHIQKIRFSDRFDYTVEVDDHILDYPIKKLLLQPLAENAILHGFSEGTPPFMLMIRVRQMGRMLLFEVANNGKKIDLQEIERRIHPPKGETPKSYGLNNVNQRLKLNYGPQSEMQFYIRGDFSYATFQIPYTAPDEEEEAE